ncbi:CPBP family intramembrane glutamic endopeptidase [Lamprobacter modestohalophilus]|uniref:CPBP family intramembrane glutamic endopeptidase n=1 Tax=Lamprobacter modestohalophilus TaxID=1064514 RepID=UPI002ADEC44B|nr:CPBP family intramembrane glutamic endopeptidase [Lamprobacter modestohalophilus]MEA1051105.1 CPBP family intramembrane glutamic endopeptidase [Lamprobacter modestohalophilus]
MQDAAASGYALRITLVFFGYLFTALLLAAALTYPLMQTGWIDYDPQRVMGRIAQLFILLGLWPFLWLMGAANRQALGFDLARADLLRAIRGGWLLGVAILGSLVLAELYLGVRIPDLDGLHPLSVLEKALAALIGGLLIGLLEELFFRGALYSAIRRRASIGAAAVGSAALYALVHFLKPHALPPGVVFDWAGTWSMFLHVFVSLFQWQHLDSLIALFSAGIFLALVRERTGHIGWSIGLHAGWVFVIQLSRRITDGDEVSSLAFLAGQYDGVIGWLAAVWIGLLAWGYWQVTTWQARRQRGRNRHDEPVDGAQS